MLNFTLVCFSLAGRMPGPSNIRAARDVYDTQIDTVLQKLVRQIFFL